MKEIVRVAAAQLAPVYQDRDATIEKACATIRRAGRDGVRLIAFPEAFIPGYPYWAMVLDPLSTSEFAGRLFEQAVEIPSPATNALCGAAHEAGCQVVMGITERAGATLYNTLLFIDADGRVLGRHRKLVPTSHERMVWGRGDGSDLNVWETDLGTVGGLICYEHSNALYRYALQAQGEEIHIAAWPGGIAIDSIIDAAVRHYAFEMQGFVINVTALLTAEIAAVLGDAARDRAALVVGGGCTAILGPCGNLLAGPCRDEEAVLHADLDPAARTRMKMVVDSIGHYARPDVVRLQIDKRPQSVLIPAFADADGAT
jgi:aliphatic nitrilase